MKELLPKFGFQLEKDWPSCRSDRPARAIHRFKRGHHRRLTSQLASQFFSAGRWIWKTSRHRSLRRTSA